MRFTVAALIVLFALSGSAAAQALGLAPAQVDHEFQPGRAFSFELTVGNDGAEAVDIRGSVNDFWYDAKGEKVFAAPGTLPLSAANWIEFVPRNFTVGPKSSARVTVTVTPPPGVQGGHYAVVFLESKPRLVEGAQVGNQPVYANIRLGALVLLAAANTLTYDVKVANGTVVPPAESQKFKLDFDAENLSNTHVFPKIQVALFDSDQNLVGKADSETKRLLPGQKSHFTVAWPGDLEPGTYQAVLTLVYGNDRVLTQEYPFSVGQ